MRIALLTDGVFPFVVGGMQRHSGYLAAHLAARGHEVTLVHAIPWNKPLPTEEEVRQALNVPSDASFRSVAIRFPKPGFLPGHYIKESYVYSRMIAQRLREQWSGFDFIYAKGFSAWHLIHEKSRGLDLPPIGVKFHGYEMFQPAAGLKGRLEAMMLRGPVKWINQKADLVFSYGGKITPIILSLGVDVSRIAEIPSAIDESWIRREEPTSVSGKRIFVFVGRNERRKGIEELLKAAASLQDSFELHIVGPFAHSARIRNPKVIYHGAVTDTADLRSILDGAHVLILPSWSEGMPNVILEAMSRGMAVIATDVGAVGEMVSESNGWIIEPGSVESLARAMKQSIDADPAVIDEKRRNSLQRVRNQFVWNVVAERVEAAIIQSLKR
ncbi:MAG: hypothetical protein RL220_1248 [Bacteroidota bacterium]